MRKLLAGDALRKRAEQLGVAMETDQSVVVPGRGNVPIIADDYELQRRVLEAERHLREHRLWLVAVFFRCCLTCKCSCGLVSCNQISCVHGESMSPNTALQRDRPKAALLSSPELHVRRLW